MAQYIVDLKETSYFRETIEADSLEEAQEKAQEIHSSDNYQSSGEFEVEDVYQDEEN